MKDGPIECSFAQSNLLFGKYELTTNYDDVFCWKPQSARPGDMSTQGKLTINIDSESQMVRIEQVGYKLTVRVSHGGAHLKLIKAKQPDTVLFSRNVLTDSTELTSTLCLPQRDHYRLLIDSCHKFTRSEPDAVEIKPDMLQRGSNTLDLVAYRHKVSVRVHFRLAEPDHAHLLKDSDLTVEARTDNQVEQVKFKLESSSADELVFTGHGWFEANKQVRFVAKSDKVLFEANDLTRTVDERDCALNLVRFDAILGVFIFGSISPMSVAAGPVEGVEVTVKTAESVVVERLSVGSASGFRLGPYKAPVSLYSVELAKPGYLFAKISEQASAKEKNVYELNYQAEKLGRLKVNIISRKYL